jgi:hypothetical protein
MTEPLNAAYPPTADGVDRLYHQLAEIHAIAASTSSLSKPHDTPLTASGD